METESDGRNIVQEAYELDIALDQEFCDCVYRSGKVMEDSSAQIIVKDIRLRSMTKYFVRVKVWAGKEESSWAETCFITGILNVQEWKALFITAENKEDAANSKGTYVRKDFFINGKVKEAFVCTTALGLYNFYINGKKVGHDELTPGWTSYRNIFVIRLMK